MLFVFILCRKISGAIVNIFKPQGTTENGENVDLRITITGSKESVSVAKYLIETRYNFIIILKTIFARMNPFRMNP